jgi:hypothetical protein
MSERVEADKHNKGRSNRVGRVRLVADNGGEPPPGPPLAAAAKAPPRGGGPILAADIISGLTARAAEIAARSCPGAKRIGEC